MRRTESCHGVRSTCCVTFANFAFLGVSTVVILWLMYSDTVRSDICRALNQSSNVELAYKKSLTKGAGSIMLL